jgi:hypothetical protein
VVIEQTLHGIVRKYCACLVGTERAPDAVAREQVFGDVAVDLVGKG